jgi:hypothetical protein
MPAWIYNILRGKRDAFTSPEIQRKYGYLYRGYKHEYYYWEMFIMFRKLILIFASTVVSIRGKIYQALATQLLVG